MEIMDILDERIRSYGFLGTVDGYRPNWTWANYEFKFKDGSHFLLMLDINGSRVHFCGIPERTLSMMPCCRTPAGIQDLDLTTIGPVDINFAEADSLDRLDQWLKKLHETLVLKEENVSSL